MPVCICLLIDKLIAWIFQILYSWVNETKWNNETKKAEVFNEQIFAIDVV